MSKPIGTPLNWRSKFRVIVAFLGNIRKRAGGAPQVILLLLWAVLAAFQPRPMQAQQPIDPTKPSKEYIYLGGRLIATEEGPVQAGGITPQSAGPTITSLSRTSAVPGESFTLTITGSHLTDCATTCGTTGNVSINAPSSQIALGTFTGSDSSLSGQVTVSSSAADGNYLVTVTTSTGADSKPFTIGQPAGPISIASDTSQIPVGSPNFLVTLTALNGSVFTSGSTVWINGSIYPHFTWGGQQAPGKIFLTIQAADTVTPKALDVTVHTPISGTAENISNTVTINVVVPSGAPNPWPSINPTGLGPTSVNVGYTGPLTVTANVCSVGNPPLGVNGNSLILINGVARPTTWNGFCSITTTLNSLDTANPGALRINVFSPAPGGCGGVDGQGVPVCGLALNTLSLPVVPASQTTGHFSIALNGNSWIKVPHNAGAQINITGQLTVEAWIYPTGNNVRQAIMEKFDPALVTPNGGYGLRLNSDRTVSFTTYQSGADFDTVASSTAVTTFNWHHVAGVFDGSQLRIYVDGALAGATLAAVGAVRRRSMMQ